MLCKRGSVMAALAYLARVCQLQLGVEHVLALALALALILTWSASSEKRFASRRTSSKLTAAPQGTAPAQRTGLIRPIVAESASGVAEAARCSV